MFDFILNYFKIDFNLKLKIYLYYFFMIIFHILWSFLLLIVSMFFDDRMFYFDFKQKKLIFFYEPILNEEFSIFYTYFEYHSYYYL